MAQDQRVEFLFAAQVSGQEQLQKLISSVDSLRKETEQLKGSNAGLASSTEAVIRNGKRYNNALDAQSKALRNTRMGTQQLGMQINDMATSISTGASPVQAFNQQIGQIGYAMSMMQGTAGAVGRFLAGPWSILVIGAAMALGPLIDNLFAVSEETKKTQKASEDLDSAVEGRVKSEDNLRIALAKTATEYRQIRLEMQANAKVAVNTALTELRARAAVLNGLLAEKEAIEGTIQGAGGLRAQSEMATGQSIGYASVTGNIRNQITLVRAQTNYLEGFTAKLNAATVDVIQANDRLSKGLGKNGKSAGSEGKSDFEKQQDKDAKSLEDFFKIIERGNTKELPEYARQIMAIEEAFLKLNAAQQASDKNRFTKIFAQDKIFLKEGQDQISEYLKTPIEAPQMSVEMEDIISKADEMRQSFDAVGNAIANSFKGMLTGAMSFKSAMQGIIGAVIDELFRLYVVKQIVGIVTSAVGLPPARANGGSVTGNQPYMVGERGPELFIPGGSGTIIPNRNLSSGGGGSSFNITVDARGSNDPAAVRAQVQQGILEAAPAIIAAAESRTIAGLRRPRLGGAMQ